MVCPSISKVRWKKIPSDPSWYDYVDIAISQVKVKYFFSLFIKFIIFSVHRSLYLQVFFSSPSSMTVCVCIHVNMCAFLSHQFFKKKKYMLSNKFNYFPSLDGHDSFSSVWRLYIVIIIYLWLRGYLSCCCLSLFISIFINYTELYDIVRRPLVGMIEAVSDLIMKSRQSQIHSKKGKARKSNRHMTTHLAYIYNIYLYTLVDWLVFTIWECSKCSGNGNSNGSSGSGSSTSSSSHQQSNNKTTTTNYNISNFTL